MPNYIRVVSKATGHETSITEARFAREKAKFRRARVQSGPEWAPPKFRTDLGGKPSPRPDPEPPAPVVEPVDVDPPEWFTPDTYTPEPVPDVDLAPESGHLADHEGEN